MLPAYLPNRLAASGAPHAAFSSSMPNELAAWPNPVAVALREALDDLQVLEEPSQWGQVSRLPAPPSVLLVPPGVARRAP